MSSFSNHQLKVKAKTWSRDSYGLYDYETTSLTIQRFNVNGPCHLSRSENEIIQGDPQLNISVNLKTEVPGNPPRQDQLLASVSDTPDGIRVISNNHGREGSDEDFWYIVKRGGDSEGYMLKTNDVIRLGRVRFRINQIKVVKDEAASGKEVNPKAIMESIKEHMQKDEENGAEALGADRKMSSTVMTCRICLCETEEPDDPLVSVCHCTGSVKYMHLKCIQNWVKSKLNMQQNKNIVTIYWKNLYCEICKQKFPINIIHKGEELSLIPIENKISGSYVVIESFSKEKDSTGIHLVDLSSNQDFRMGRGHDCDLKIPDISVSRVHALLVVSRGNLYLKDNMSKFGTLVLHRGSIVLNNDTPKSPWLQCGRTIMKFSIKKPWFSYLPCGLGSLFNNNKIGNMFGENKRNREERATEEGEELRRNDITDH